MMRQVFEGGRHSYQDMGPGRAEANISSQGGVKRPPVAGVPVNSHDRKDSPVHRPPIRSTR